MNCKILTLVLILTFVNLFARAADARPNIVFLLSDDQRFDAMGCAGSAIIKTPQMDALAKDGVRFKNMFATTAICAASRASMLTGLHERTHRYTFNTPPIMLPQHSETSYPAVLRRAGYKTGFVGKFGVDVEKGETAKMFDYFVPLDRSPYWKKQPDGSLKHLTDIEGEKAIAFLDTVKAGEPFCLSVSFNAPHAEDTDPKQYFWQHECDELYKDARIPVPKTMTEEIFNAQQPFVKTSESRVRFNWRFNEPQKYQEMVKAYYRMISGVDLVIGRIRDELQKRGLADNTVIVFASDNGYFLGERGLADKWYIYELSCRVPLIIYDPRVPKDQRGKEASPVALNIDIPPTILSLAGAEIPKIYQGRALQPLLKGESPLDWRRDFLYEHLFERPNIPKSEGVRGERFTYVRWFEAKPLAEELYDRDADPDQLSNLVSDLKFADELQKLRKRTDELRDQYGGPYVPRPKTASTKNQDPNPKQ
jgi:arylsulfatase A-like enzyme